MRCSVVALCVSGGREAPEHSGHVDGRWLSGVGAWRGVMRSVGRALPPRKRLVLGTHLGLRGPFRFITQPPGP